MKTLLLHSFFGFSAKLPRTAENDWERLRKTGKDWEARQREHGTTGLRDHGTTRQRDSGTTKPRDYETTRLRYYETAKNTAVLSRSQAFSGILSCAGQLGVRVVQQYRR